MPQRRDFVGLHELDEEHGPGAHTRHLTLMYSVRIKDEASPAFSGHRDDVVVLADVLVGKSRSLEPIIAEVVRPVRRVRDQSRSAVGQNIVRLLFQNKSAGIVWC